MSVISLLLCCSMLIGTTFAWFTDEVSSKNSIIKSGNLDIELYYAHDAQAAQENNSWTKVDSETNIFDETLWEPGKTQVVYFKIVNEGTLALKYNLGVSVYNETPGTTLNAAGEEVAFNLSDYVEFGVYQQTAPETFASRELARNAVADNSTKLNVPYTKADKLLEQNETDYLAVVVYMPETVGNEANYLTGTEVPEIFLGINLFATQQMNEADSFGPEYDDAAPWTGAIDVSWYNTTDTEFVLTSAEDLAGLAAIVNGTATSDMTRSAIGMDDFKGKTIKLDADLDLRNIPWTPIGAGDVNGSWIGFNGIFDGQGHTIYNLNVTKGGGWNGLFGLIGRGTTTVTESVSNLTIQNVTIEGANRMTGGVVGQIYGNIENCHVMNVTITAIPNAVGDTYDNGDKVGGIVGWHGDNGNNHYIKGCSATEVTLKAYRDMGGIAGYIGQSSSVTGCAVKKIDFTVDQITNHYGVKADNARSVVGRVYAEPVTVENNTVENTTFTFNLATSSYEDLMSFGGCDGNYVLSEDIAADNILYFGPGTQVSMDLGGQNITASNPGQYIFGAQEGKLVLDGEGTVDCGKGFMASSNGEIEINGGTYNASATGTLNNIKHHSLAQNGAKIVVNDGIFTSNVEDAVIFFATSNARIEINGGFFENTVDATPDLLGMGTNGSNTNRIVITGGTFVNYNPLSDRMCYTGTWPAGGEAQFSGPWMLIPGGYEVVSETQANGDIWYSVVPVQ